MKRVICLNTELYSILTTVLLFVLSVGAHSQTIEEIIVTATMRAESLQDVPISVTALFSENIESIGAYKLQDLNGIVPNFQIGENAILDDIRIRGVATSGNQGFDQAVGVFRDGVYTGQGYLSRLPFMDLQRVEVVRGPQGTLFGRSTIGGALTLISNDPGEEFEFGGRTQIALDSEEDYEFEGYVTGPLSDTVRFRVAGRYRDSEGFLTNLGENNRTEPQLDEYAVRGTLEWDITNDWMATAKYEHADWLAEGRTQQIFATTDPVRFSDGTLDEISDITNRGTIFDGTGRESAFIDSNADFFSLKLNGSIGNLSVESTTGYTAYEIFGAVDGDFASLPAFSINNIPGEDYEQISQEIRLLSPSEGRLTWIAGLYYEDNTYQMREEVEIGSFFGNPLNHKFSTDFDQDQENISLFGQATYDMTDVLHLTGGLRYTHMEKEATQAQFFAPVLPAGNRNALAANHPFAGFLSFLTGVIPHTQSGKRTENRVDWSVNLEYEFEWSGEHTTYFSVAQGSKAGGFDARSASVSPAYEFNDEKAINYEWGLKSVWLDGAMNWNWAVFYTDYEDLQVSVFDGTLTFVVGNAAQVKIWGLETDMQWQLTDNLSVWGNLAYLDFEYTSFPGASCPPGRVGSPNPFVCDLSGVPGVSPEWTGAAGFNYSHPITDSLNFLSSFTVTYADSYVREIGAISPLHTLPSYTKVTAQVGVGSSDGRWAVNILGSNLTNELSCGDLAQVPLSFGTASVCSAEPPRTFYLQASYNY